MNTIKKYIGWLVFVVIIALIIWGMIAASQKANNNQSTEVAIPLPTPISSSTDWIRGNPNATTTLVEYGDFECPACQAYYPVVEQVFALASSSVKWVFREFPLPQHPDALPAAKAAEAAGLQGQFWGMYNLLYSNHADWDTLADPTPVFDQYAQKLGLNMTKFDSDMNSSAVAQKIQNEITTGTNAGIDATPTFFVNGYRIQNPESLDEFLTALGIATSTANVPVTP